jgi:hypothetical protein
MTQTMTTTSTTATDRDRARAALPAVATIAVVLAAALTAFGIWGDGTPGAEPQAREFLVICAFIGVAAALVLGWLVPRKLRRESAPGAALTLSILGLVLVLAFWSGLPPVLAAGGILLGWAGRRESRVCQAALVVGVLAVGADIGVYVLEAMSTNG